MGSAEAPGESSAGGARSPRLSIPVLSLVEQAAAAAAVEAAEERWAGAPEEQGAQAAPRAIPVLALDDQGHVEGSNVNTIDTLVAMIEAQRAFEIQSKVMQTENDLLSKSVNNLPRTNA